MEFTPTPIAGAFLVKQSRHVDERGYFARTFCAKEFVEHGLGDRFVQSSVSFNAQRGTLRGMHWASPPAAETKLVSCQRGSIYDVIADLRPASPTRGKWVGFELAAESGDAVYIPEGVAHGFLTLTHDCVVSYAISQFFDAAASRGFRYDDPAFGILWPGPVAVISERDLTYPPLAR